MSSLTPIRLTRERLSDTVADNLRRQIANQSLQPGDLLPSESDLALSHGVSKAVIRSALGSLATLGLIEIRQGKPTSVIGQSNAPLDHFFRFALAANPEGLREAIELRRAIESETAGLAAVRATSAQILELDDVIGQMRTHVDDADKLLLADLAFHQTLVRCAGNSLIASVADALSDVTRHSMRLVSGQTDLRDPQAMVERHADIFAAVRAGSAEAARLAMHAHFDASQSVLQAIDLDQSRLQI